ncbi:MAG: YihY/virulence factor BrkB family protein [Chloroflexi bacterium]|nr:YihY/virulence factor BrkB family protein [Chloroflexota bacterium]
MANGVKRQTWGSILRRLGRTLRMTITLYSTLETGQRAAALAYYSLLSLFPLLLLLVSFLSRWVTTATAQQTVLTLLRTISPLVPDLVVENIEYVVAARGSLNAIAAVGLIWSASGLFAAIIQSLDRVWGGEAGRAFWEHRLISLLLVTGVLLLFIISIIVGSILSILPQVIAFLLPLDHVWLLRWWQYVPTLVSLGMDVFLYALLYRYLPHRRPPWPAVWAGAVVAGLGWNGAKVGFALYLRHFARYGLVYGTLATLVAFLFWIYLSGLVLLIGAEFGFAWERVMMKEA